MVAPYRVLIPYIKIVPILGMEEQLKDSDKQEIKDAMTIPFDLSTNIREGKEGLSPCFGKSSRSRGLLAMVVFKAGCPGKCGRQMPRSTAVAARDALVPLQL